MRWLNSFFSFFSLHNFFGSVYYLNENVPVQNSICKYNWLIFCANWSFFSMYADLNWNSFVGLFFGFIFVRICYSINEWTGGIIRIQSHNYYDWLNQTNKSFFFLLHKHKCICSHAHLKNFYIVAIKLHRTDKNRYFCFFFFPSDICLNSNSCYGHWPPYKLRCNTILVFFFK